MVDGVGAGAGEGVGIVDVVGVGGAADVVVCVGVGVGDGWGVGDGVGDGAGAAFGFTPSGVSSTVGTPLVIGIVGTVGAEAVGDVGMSESFVAAVARGQDAAGSTSADDMPCDVRSFTWAVCAGPQFDEAAAEVFVA